MKVIIILYVTPVTLSAAKMLTWGKFLVIAALSNPVENRSSQLVVFPSVLHRSLLRSGYRVLRLYRLLLLSSLK